MIGVIGLPLMSEPVSSISTPAIPTSPGSTTPSLLASSHTLPVMPLLVGTSANRLSVDVSPGLLRSMLAILLDSGAAPLLAVPLPVLVLSSWPAVVLPCAVPTGWVGSIRV
ncbi:hypothetical protein D3C81_1401890 [compost metagenome]